MNQFDPKELKRLVAVRQAALLLRDEALAKLKRGDLTTPMSDENTIVASVVLANKELLAYVTEHVDEIEKAFKGNPNPTPN